MLGIRTFLAYRADLRTLSSKLSTSPTVYCLSSAAGKNGLFFAENVQALLKKLTRKDLDKVFRKRRDEKKVEPAVYKFLTTAQLEEEMIKADKEADRLLQMPPVLEEAKDEECILTEDEKLIGLFKSKMIFTDISMGKSGRNRSIVVREPSGTLRAANLGERARMNQIYFPRNGREIWIPVVFNDENLNPLLEKKEYEFILDKACAQFEPDDAEYIRVSRKTYNHINSTKEFNLLRSTRHFGSLVYHLVLTKNLDNLLLENLETDRLEDAIWAIQLHNIIHPEEKVQKSNEPGEELQFLKAYIDQCASDKGKLELAYKAFKDYLKSPAVAVI